MREQVGTEDAVKAAVLSPETLSLVFVGSWCGVCRRGLESFKQGLGSASRYGTKPSAGSSVGECEVHIALHSVWYMVCRSPRDRGNESSPHLDLTLPICA